MTQNDSWAKGIPQANCQVYDSEDYLLKIAFCRIVDMMLANYSYGNASMLSGYDGYFDVQDVEECAKALEALGGKRVHHVLSQSLLEEPLTKSVVISWNDAVVHVFISEEHIGVSVYALSSQKRDDLVAAIKSLENTEKRQTLTSVFCLVKGHSSPVFERTFDIDKMTLVRENYDVIAVEGFETVKAMLMDKKPENGRLVIVDGPPGTGKTHMIRGLINEVSPHAAFVSMKADMIPAMLEPEFLTVCKKFKRRLGGAPIVFVIEDADKVVASRMNDNVSALSDLLNLTDGLAGTALDIRVIATTNANVEEFDHAVLRPGRLAARIELGPLDAERANIIFERLGSSKRTDVPMTLAEVYASSRGTKNVFVKQAKRKMAGFLR